MSESPSGVVVDEALARPSELLKEALNTTNWTFDMLRDPNWQPSRDDYAHMRDALLAELGRLETERDDWMLRYGGLAPLYSAAVGRLSDLQAHESLTQIGGDHLEAMRDFAGALDDTFGPLFGRDVIRLADAYETLRRAVLVVGEPQEAPQEGRASTGTEAQT